MLVESGADVNAWGQGDTPLLRAADGGNQEVYDYLYPLVSEDIRKHGPAELERGIKRKERLQLKDVEAFIEAAMYGNLEAVKAAIENGIDINASNGQTALMYAAVYGHTPVVQALLDAGASPDIFSDEDVPSDGQTALMQVATSFFAAGGRRREVIQAIARAGANLNAKDSEGRTALIWAAIGSYADSVTALIEVGADLDAKDADGNTALMVAKDRKFEKLVNLLRSAGASEEGIEDIALLQAAKQGNIEEVQSLIKAGADVNHRLHTTALCNAATNGHYEIVRMLIDADADVNLRESEAGLPARRVPVLYLIDRPARTRRRCLLLWLVVPPVTVRSHRIALRDVPPAVF